MPAGVNQEEETDGTMSDHEASVVAPGFHLCASSSGLYFDGIVDEYYTNIAIHKGWSR